MRNIVFLFAMLCLPFLVAADAATPTVRLAWDAPTTNADGTPLADLAGYVLAVTGPAVDLRTGGTPLATLDLKDPTPVNADATPLLAGITLTKVRFWILAYDASGNKSAWSNPAEYDKIPPDPAKNLRVTVTVTVEVP
jgi:hypothetical protein